MHVALREIGLRTSFLRGGRSRLLQRLAPHHRLPPTAFEVDFFGKTYAGDLSNWIDWHVYFMGAYAPAELALMRRVARGLRAERGAVTYADVGANVGHHVLFMAGEADAIFAFEPFPRAAAAMRRNLERNGLTNVRLFELALGREEGALEMVAPDAHNLGAATLRPVDGAERFTVPIVRGDTLFAEANLPRIDILKVDVEGHEAAVLEGLAERLRADRPVILLELTCEDRSGFRNEAHFRAALYPGHVLYTVETRGDDYRLAPFDFEGWEIVCLPEELARLV